MSAHDYYNGLRCALAAKSADSVAAEIIRLFDDIGEAMRAVMDPGFDMQGAIDEFARRETALVEELASLSKQECEDVAQALGVRPGSSRRETISNVEDAIVSMLRAFARTPRTGV